MSRPYYIWSIKHIDMADMGVGKWVLAFFCCEKFAELCFIIESWL